MQSVWRRHMKRNVLTDLRAGARHQSRCACLLQALIRGHLGRAHAGTLAVLRDKERAI